MNASDDKKRRHNITLIMVGVIILAMVVITALAVTAILSGPPSL
jgi:hypothetical protein